MSFCLLVFMYAVEVTGPRKTTMNSLNNRINKCLYEIFGLHSSWQNITEIRTLFYRLNRLMLLLVIISMLSFWTTIILYNPSVFHNKRYRDAKHTFAKYVGYRPMST